jgi:hypothetical protein
LEASIASPPVHAPSGFPCRNRKPRPRKAIGSRQFSRGFGSAVPEMGSGMSSARRRRFGLEASRGMLPLLALQVLIEYGRAGASRPPVTAALLAANSLVYLRPGALDGVLPSLARVSFNPQLIIEVPDLF